ncbi:MAG: hypothetical protein H6623_02435 [Bdellovibrionaceae bacterium]|nr:hypothetical protein [Pseudobdellovibrionaceae bacterium]
MKTCSFLTKVLFFVLSLSPLANAELLFEGYYKIQLENQHLGYFIQRYALDANTKLFSSTYYFLTQANNVTTIESLNAKSNVKFEPQSYQYSRLEGKNTKAIDALVKGKKLVMKIVENGKATAKEISINDKVFLSTFLSYLMMKTPKGVSVGNKFTYTAIAEEDGSVESGEAYVKEQVKEQGLDTFRTLNTFKKEEFVNWLDTKGESIKTHVPKLNLTAELVTNPKDAYKDMPFNESSIKLLFGNVPEGKTNMLFKK